jgi:hypothetical protein
MMRTFLAVWLALVIAVSITPVSFKLKLHMIGQYHNYGHYVVYAVTGIMLWLIAEQWTGKVAAFLFGFAVGFAQEWAENRLYHAGFEWRDVGTDLAGLITGFALMLLITTLLEDPDAKRLKL